MAAGFEYFTSADAGAPVLNGAAGRMIAVLDWVLVGKGGWAKEFTGTNLAVYRSATGNRFRLRLDDTQTKYTRLRAYRDMTAVSTGTTPFPTTGQAATAWGVAKAFTAGALARPYWGIRTNRYLLMFVQHLDYDGAAETWWVGNHHGFFAFGDVPSLCESDAHNTIVTGSTTAVLADDYFTNPNYMIQGDSVYPSFGITGTTVTAGVSGNPGGSIASPTAAIVRPFPGADGGSSTAMNVVKLSGRLHYAPMMIVNGNSTGTAVGTMLRALVPNFHQVYGECTPSPGDGPTYWKEEFSIGGREFITMQGLQSTTSPDYRLAFLLEKTDTDGAL